MASTNPARGMRDFLPADVRKREYVIGIIKEVYESYGYEPLETPSVENLETLMGKYGEEGNQLIFKILKRGEKLAEVTKLRSYDSGQNSSQLRNIETSQLSDLALRYDLTVPLARVVANRRNDIPKFFKRYQIQPVWRADRPAKGRYREFYQCDVDAIGSKSISIEVEQITAVSEVLTRLGFDNFLIKLNHRRLLTGILECAGIPVDKQIATLIALDKRDKIGDDAVAEELHQIGVGEQSIKFLNVSTNVIEGQSDELQQLLGIVSLAEAMYEANKRGLERLAGNVINNPHGLFGIQELRDLLTLLAGSTAAQFIQIDPGLARGLSYYTGTIMEINVPDLAGSLGGGGRYDGLIGMFGKEQIPACGFSLGLERIIVVMDERGMFPPEIAQSRSADVMVTIWNEDSIAESMRLADELRAQALRVLLYPEADKLGKQFKYADSIKIPFTCVLGESELSEGKVTLKNMTTGDQKTIPRESLAAAITERAS